eukprot:3896186-Pyramimonas_sp.AAC.1
MGKSALRLEFPPEVLGLELHQCMAARCVRQAGAYGSPFAPTRSIVQGLRSGTCFGKCATSHILQHITTCHVNMSRRLWVDSFSQTVRGSRVAVRNQLVDCLVDACHQLQDHGLK